MADFTHTPIGRREAEEGGGEGPHHIPSVSRKLDHAIKRRRHLAREAVKARDEERSDVAPWGKQWEAVESRGK